MKLDEKYFEAILEKLNCHVHVLANGKTWIDGGSSTILYQIAKDAFAAGAEAQKNKIDILATLTLSQLLCSMKMGEPFSSKISDKLMSSVRQAINSATVKWEVRGVSELKPCPFKIEVLKRWWLICCERADRHIDNTGIFAVWWGKRLAIEQIIKHIGVRGE